MIDTNMGARREQLAELAHEQWTGWMRYMFSRCEPCADGVRIPSAWVERWQRQMDTPYSKLSEREKDSDRKEADRMLAALPQTTGWQPIETAPKDGTWVLLDDATAVPDVGRWFSTGKNERGFWCVHAIRVHPVRWMPLPPSPSSQE